MTKATIQLSRQMPQIETNIVSINSNNYIKCMCVCVDKEFPMKMS